MSRLHSMGGPVNDMIVVRPRHLLFTSCLCAVMLVPFFIFPSATTHSSFMDLWSTEEWAETTGPTGESRTTIEAPLYPPESEATIQEDPQAARKRFQQVHLSIHNNENAYIDAIEKGRRGRVGASPQMGITWVDNLALPPPSDDPTSLVTAATDDLPTDDSAAVKYGLSKEDYPFTASASTHTYHHGGWKGLIHDVLLPDLRPSTRYYYRVGNLRTDEWSDEFHFTSPPLPPFLLPRSFYPIRLHSSSSSSSSPLAPPSSLSFSSSFSSFFASSSSSSSLIDTSSLTSSASSQLPRAAEEEESEDGPDLPESPVLASLAVFGDNGISGNGQKVISRIREDPAIDAVVHIGDFAYSLKRGGKWTVDSEQYATDKQAAWDMWFRMVEPLAAYKPYMAVPGNHETYRFDFHFVPFAHRFFMPGKNSGFWYWFDYSSIHFVAVSSDHNYTRGSDQYLWLDAHLAEFNRARNDWVRVQRRARRPRGDVDRNNGRSEEERERERNTAWWLVVLVHRAMYSSSVEQGSVLHLRHELEPLFIKHGVDIVAHGHDHNYERTHPVVKEKAHRVERSEGVYVKSCAEQVPPIYLRAGTGGIELGTIWDPQPSWSAAVFNQAYGYMRFTAYANNTLKTEFVSAQDAQVKDTLVLIKDPLVQCDRGSFSSSSEDYSPWWLLFGVGLALSVACQARYCRRNRRRVFDMQHFFNANGSGGYITSTWAS